MLSEEKIPESLKAHLLKESEGTSSVLESAPNEKSKNQKEETSDDKSYDDEDDIIFEEGNQKEALNLE